MRLGVRCTVTNGARRGDVLSCRVSASRLPSTLYRHPSIAIPPRALLYPIDTYTSSFPIIFGDSILAPQRCCMKSDQCHPKAAHDSGRLAIRVQVRGRRRVLGCMSLGSDMP